MNLSFLSTGFTADVFQRLAECLLHFLWQGSVLAVVVLLADGCLRRGSAQWRYAIHVAALLLMLACVPVTYAVIEGRSSGEYPVVTGAAENPVAAIPAAVVGKEQELSADLASVTADEHSAVAGAMTPPSSSSRPGWEQVWQIAHFAAPYAAVAYLLGVALMFGRLASALIGGHRLCAEARPITEENLIAMVARQARKIGLRTIPVIAWCSRTSVPLVAGLIKPMILLPVSLASSLTPDQLEALLAHELAHLRRFDLLVNLLQRIAEAVLFFHPAVWYVSRRISSERENCCDDSVLRAGWGRVEYADALVRMAEICGKLPGIGCGNAAEILAAAGDNPSQFKRRILRLLGEQESLRLGVSRGMAVAILCGILAIILAVPVLFSSPSLVAQNEKEDTPKETLAKKDEEPKTDREPEVLPGHYRVSFHNVPWQDVLAWYGRVMGDRIDTKIVPEGNFSFEGPRPLNQRELSLLINSELLRRNYCLAEEGGGFAVKPADVISRQYAEQLRKDFMHGSELRKGKDKFESYFEIVNCQVAGQTKLPAPSGPAIAYVLKANRDFSAQEATSFFAACFADISIPSLKTGQPVLADGFAILHGGKWLGKKAPALQKGEQIEVWQNYAQEWNSRPPHDYHLVIKGSIIGLDGKPLASARVQQLLLEEAPDGKEGKALEHFLNRAYGGELIVDKDGKFQVTLHHGSKYVRKAYLHVWAPGYSPQRIGPIAIGHERPAVPLKIELKPGFSGRLRLVLPDGKALDKGEVDVTVQDDLWTWSQPMAKLPVIAGESTTVPNCPTGPLLLKVRVPGFVEQEVRDVQLAADKVTEVRVPLTPKEVFYFRGEEALKRIESVKPAWSESQFGIEFGIAQIGDKKEFRSGERVPLELFIRNTGKEAVKVEFATDFLWNVPEVKNERGEAVEVEKVFALGSVALYRETLKPGEAFGFRHLGVGLGPNPAPGKENWTPNWAEPKAGKYTLRHTHMIDVDSVDESKPGNAGMFTTGAIEFEVAAPPAEKVPPAKAPPAKAPAAEDPFAPKAPAAKPAAIAPKAPLAPAADPFGPSTGANRYEPAEPPRNGVRRRLYRMGDYSFVSQEENYKDGKLHGPSLDFDSSGKVYMRQNYKEGKLDGFKRFYSDGKVIAETFYRDGKPEGKTFDYRGQYKKDGQYLNGIREGHWTLEQIGAWSLVRDYKEGRPHGLWERKNAEGKSMFRMVWDQGVIVEGGENVKGFSFLHKVSALAKEGDALAKKMINTLDVNVDFDYPQTRAGEVAEDLHDRLDIPIFVDRLAEDAPDLAKKPIDANEKNLPLFLALHELSAKNGLFIDYHFHSLWLTTPKAAAAWKDTTGVSDLKPAAGSPLAKALPQLPKFDMPATPIAKLAEPLQKEYGLTLDASRVKDAKWTGWPQLLPPEGRSLSFRDSLSILLYQNRCRCREEGGKLIIEPIGAPPKEKVEPAKEKPAAADQRVAPGTGLRINVPALGPTPLPLDFAFPINAKETDQKQTFSFFFGVSRQ